MCVQNNYEKLCCHTLGTRYETTIASLAGYTCFLCNWGVCYTSPMSFYSRWGQPATGYWGSKVDRLGVIYVSTILVCPRSADYHFLDRVPKLSHQNDRVVPILVTNMLICLWRSEKVADCVWIPSVLFFADLKLGQVMIPPHKVRG